MAPVRPGLPKIGDSFVLHRELGIPFMGPFPYSNGASHSPSSVWGGGREEGALMTPSRACAGRTS